MDMDTVNIIKDFEVLLSRDSVKETWHNAFLIAPEKVVNSLGQPKVFDVVYARVSDEDKQTIQYAFASQAYYLDGKWINTSNYFDNMQIGKMSQGLVVVAWKNVPDYVFHTETLQSILDTKAMLGN